MRLQIITGKFETEFEIKTTALVSVFLK